VYRIEAGIFTRFITAMEYAEVMGYEIDFHLVPLPLEGDE
jgi:hypothetical protein